MSFSELGLTEDVLKAVDDAGYTEPTPIQKQAIPIVLMGRDVLGCAQTGTGKTASFTLPMIDILASGRAKARMPRTLILEPTRELAAQVADNFDTYGKYNKLSMALLIGGVSMEEQKAKLDRGVDVLIATPGRLLDLFERGGLLLTDTKMLVIDEADRMLDMGFIPDVEKIVSLLPKIRQTLFFSATMPPAIRKLADMFLMNPKEISVAPPSSTSANIVQGMYKLQGRGQGGQMQWRKRSVLRKLLHKDDVRNAIIFCNRKRDVGILHRSLTRHGFNAGQLHGDMVQSARMETLDQFKAGEITMLVCSDVAARGIDIKDMSHVFNFDVPTHSEDYVHRIGRTGRAGKEGHAYTIATSDDEKYLGFIKKTIGKEVPELDLKELMGEDYDEVFSSRNDNEGKGQRDNRRGGRSRKPRETRSETPDEARKVAEDNTASNNERNERNDRNNRNGQRNDKRRGRGRNRDNGYDDEPDIPVKGFGDNVPAFFLQEAVIVPEKKEKETTEEKPKRKARKTPSRRKKAEKAPEAIPADEQAAAETVETTETTEVSTPEVVEIPIVDVSETKAQDLPSEPEAQLEAAEEAVEAVTSAEPAVGEMVEPVADEPVVEEKPEPASLEAALANIEAVFAPSLVEDSEPAPESIGEAMARLEKAKEVLNAPAEEVESEPKIEETSETPEQTDE